MVTPGSTRVEGNRLMAEMDGGRPAVAAGPPDGLLAAIPFLVGFYPSRSMVVVGAESPRGRVRLTLRYDLPDPPHHETAAGIAGHAISMLGEQGIAVMAAVGYGPGELVRPVAGALRAAAERAGLQIRDILRAEHGRYWSFLHSCPTEGMPYTVEGHAVAAELRAAGLGVLDSRDALAATLAPAGGQDAKAMEAATRRAEKRATGMAGESRARRELRAAGLQAVKEAVAHYRAGGSMEAGDAAAWLSVVLGDLRVRDDAWARMDPEHREAHCRLWTDVTRLARPGHVAPAASLLTFTAWQSGNGTLANVALDRALADDPQYSMARLLRQAIGSGAPPELARIPMTPEEVAASYEKLDGEAAKEL